MGLDTISYSRIEATPADWEPPMIDGNPDWDALDESGITRAATYSAFPAAMDGLEGGHDPDPDHPGMIGSRWYQLTNPGPGTYSGYIIHGAYRDAIVAEFWTQEQAQAGRDSAQRTGAPFADLVWFADDGGILGPAACTRLANSFARHPDLPGPYSALHKEWAAAAAHAAPDGCIRFH